MDTGIKRTKEAKSGRGLNYEQLQRIIEAKQSKWIHKKKKWAQIIISGGKE